MSYIIETRDDAEHIIEKLHAAKEAICDAMEELESELSERRSYRHEYRRRGKGRYDY